MRTVLVVIHAVSGLTGLLLAVPVLRAPKRRGRHTRLGRWYAAAATGLSLSAFGLFAYRPAQLWGLLVLGVLTLGWLVGGLFLARVRPRGMGRRGWRIWHLNLMGSTVIAFATGAGVQLTGGHVVAWVAPTVIGSVLISRATAREVAARPQRRDGAPVIASGMGGTPA